MANRERKNELKIYLSDDEQYILEQKVKASGMKSKSAFLRQQILYGYVYAADVKTVKELMKQVWDTQKAMLSKQPCRKYQS
ncbi:MAG: hypothetical protein K2J99_12965 [Lachnospiraceae bacterium]|nr:hypothetical protein [Lachnospiraceae bacterium]